jgi:hypothetical protein
VPINYLSFILSVFALCVSCWLCFVICVHMLHCFCCWSSGDWRRFHREKPHNLHCSPDIQRAIRTRRIIWRRQGAQWGGGGDTATGCSWTNLTGKIAGKIQE